MRIVVAPDKFMGSVEASEVTAHLAAGIQAVDPSVAVAQVPVADGGEVPSTPPWEPGSSRPR